jgi:Na+:H+ antiporter, NhaA family
MSTLTEPIGPNDHAIGRANARVQLVEYGDYGCPFCARAHYETTEVLRRAGDDLRYAFRHFPLVQIHPHSHLAAQAAEAAGAQGRFWPMHSLCFMNQAALEPDTLMVHAATLGLDVHRFARELRAGTHRPKVQTDFRTGVCSGVRGTPTFFLNGIRHDGRSNAESLTAAIRDVVRRTAWVPPPEDPTPPHR